MNTPTSDQSNQPIHRTPSWERRRRTAVVVGGLAFAAAVLGACSSSSPKSSGTAAPVASSASAAMDTTPLPADNAATAPTDSVATTKASTGSGAASGGAILPVANNPIVNTATPQTLKIDSVLVENNLDASGKPASDHLEIALSNTGTTDATDIEVFYTFTDPTAAATENYYTKLPADFTIPAGGKRVVHFDDTAAPDHFPVNKFSLYYTSTNAMDVSVTVSAKDAAVQKLDLKKDAGGAEAAD